MSRPKVMWPEADREMFETLFTTGGPLDARGPLAHVRSTTRKSLAGRYAQWLSWLYRAAPDALRSPPVERSAMDRMTDWLNDREDLAPMSRLALFDAILQVLSAAHPHLDWNDHKALRARLRRAAGHGTQARKQGRILSSRVLLDAGLRVSETAAALPAGRMARAIGLRDGAMIALLALLPMRRHALAGLQIGPSVFVSETRITIALPELLVKSGRPWETEAPEPCLSVLRRYLDDGRPVLAARGAGDDPHLWLDRSGKGLSYDYIGPRIASVTERVLGKRIPPHFFRDAAATTLARMSPESTKLIRPILGHSSDRTAERHYNHARSIEAGRSYAALVAHLKETSR
ncbi:Phage integrase family protein [Roseivivax marinus]|nr:Phage integrase family protein [Roseivivax marinus]